MVFRSLLQRESRLPPWRELVRVYRRLEARGEIRGGRFVAGFGGEQFAAPDAVGRLRAVRKMEKTGELVVLSAADPLNLVGILTPEARVAGDPPQPHPVAGTACRSRRWRAASCGGWRRASSTTTRSRRCAARRSHQPLHPYLRSLSGRKPAVPPIVYRRRDVLVSQPRFTVNSR